MDPQKGYIAKKSGHSRGSTIDLAIAGLDFGTPLDWLGVESNTKYPDISQEQKDNREILVRAMEKHGFKNLWKEWWHFTLVNEPFPDTFFDFVNE